MPKAVSQARKLGTWQRCEVEVEKPGRDAAGPRAAGAALIMLNELSHDDMRESGRLRPLGVHPWKRPAGIHEKTLRSGG